MTKSSKIDGIIDAGTWKIHYPWIRMRLPVLCFAIIYILVYVTSSSVSADTEYLNVNTDGVATLPTISTSLLSNDSNIRDASSSSSSSAVDDDSYEFIRLHKHDQEIAMWKTQIDELIDDELLTKAYACSHLGSLYRERDLRWKTGGTLEGLSSINKAIAYFNQYNATISDLDHIIVNKTENYKFLFSLFVQKGMLSARLGLGAAAIDAYDQTISVTDTLAPTENLKRFDLASLLFLKGDAFLSILYDGTNAAINLKESISLNPCNTGVYLLYAQACKLTHGYDSIFWYELIEQLLAFEERLSDKDQCIDVDGNSLLAGTLLQYNIKEYISDDMNGDSETVVDVSGIYWALYECYARVNNKSLAWKYLALAHSVHANKYNYSEDQMNSAKTIITTFHKDYWPNHINNPSGATIGSSSKTPVFIIGFFRSGSTLLESMLDVHPAIYGIGESKILSTRMDEMLYQLSDHRTRGMSDDIFAEIISNTSTSIIDDMTKKVIEMNEYNASFDRTNIVRIVDKMLYNYKHIGLIHLVFPNAIILHTVRDPMDTLYSCYKTKFNSAVWTHDTKSIVSEYIAYLTVMQHFRSVLPPGRVVDVNYESLVLNPEKVMKYIVKDVLQLQWDSSVLEYYKYNRPVHTSSVLQVKRSLYPDSIGSWLSYKEGMSDIRKRLSKQINALMYSNDSISGSASSQLLFYSHLQPRYLNWYLDPTFNYTDMIQRLAHLPVPTTAVDGSAASDAYPIDEANAAGIVVLDTLNTSYLEAWKYYNNIVELNAVNAMLANYTVYTDDRTSVHYFDDLKRALVSHIQLLGRKCYVLTLLYDYSDGVYGEAYDVVIDTIDHALYLAHYVTSTYADVASIDVDLLYLKARFYYRVGEYEYAMLMFKHLLSHNLNKGSTSSSGSTPSSQSLDFNLYLDIANCYREVAYVTVDAWKAILQEMLQCISTHLSDGDLLSNDDLHRVLTDDNISNEKLKTMSASAKDKRYRSIRIQNTGIYWAAATASAAILEHHMSWSFLDRAHSLEGLKAKHVKYNLTSTILATRLILSTYNRGFWPDHTATRIGFQTKRYVFIVGFPSSGADIVDKLFHLHKSIISFDDSIFNATTAALVDGIHGMMSNASALSMDTSLSILHNLVRDSGTYTTNAIKERLKLLNIHNKHYYRPSSKRKIKYVVDKMLYNYKHIGLIHLVFPNAIILHTVRDPMDTLYSCYKTKFNSAVWTHDTKSIVSEYIAYLTVMQHFRSVLPPGRVVDVNYESLVLNPEKVMKYIVKDVLQLQWDSSVLDNTIFANDFQVNYDDDRIGSWRYYNKDIEGTRVELLKYIGNAAGSYPLQPSYLNWKLDPLFRYSDMISNLTRAN